MKTGVENGMFWSEIGPGFGEPGAHPPTEGYPPVYEVSTPLSPGIHHVITSLCRLKEK